MAALGAIHEDVAFGWDEASELSGQMRSAATLLEWQNGERESIRGLARTVWQGRYGDEFDHRVRLGIDDAGRFVTSLRAAADGLDELARLAREEQNRRIAAREWVASQDDDGWGVPIVDDIVDAGSDLLFGDDVPAPPPPVDPPTIPVGDPGAVSREAQPATATPVWRTGGTSSAKPEDLDEWVSSVQGLDEAVTTQKGAMAETHTEFRGSLGWGSFDASSLITAIGTWLGFNATDRGWVATIAQAFRDAGSGTLSDAVIDARLEAAGLDAPRAAVTYDEPVLWGEPPTSGYADDPVNTGSGNFVETEVDLEVDGLGRLLRFSRVHNSRSDRVGPFGRGWASWASCRLRAEPEGAQWVGPDGQEVIVPPAAASGPDGARGYQRVVGLAGLVVVHEDGLALERFDGSRVGFDGEGRPSWTDHGPGTRVVFEHDEDGRLVALAHAGRREVRLRWQGDRIVRLDCSDGRTVRYRYDERAQLVGVDGGPRGHRGYEVDDQGRAVAVTDADGVVEARNIYDEDGRVLAQTAPHGRRSRFRYLAGQVTMVDDDAGGPVNSYVHDDHGRLVAAVDGTGQTLTKVYDRWGNPTRVVERDGTVTVQDWDDRARLTRREGPDGTAVDFAYDNLDRLVEVTAAAAGVTIRYRYEGDERVPREVVDAEGAVTRREVVDGLVGAVVDPDGVATRYDYDVHGLTVAVTDGGGHTTTIERDPAGRVTAVVSPSGLRHELVLDEAGRVTVHRDSTGAESRFEWSPAGRLLAVVDPGGGRWELRYGADGALAQVVDERGAVTSQRLDPLGNVVALELADGATWTFDYDQLCRLTATHDPLGGTWSRAYDPIGRLVATTDPADVRRELGYDPGGRLVRVADAITWISFELDPLGRVRAVRRPDGSESALSYDRCGRVTSVADQEGGGRRYRYTPAGRLAGVVSPLGHVSRFEHDRCGRRTAVVDPLGRRWGCEYDAEGRVSQASAPTGETLRFRYDAAGRVTARESSAGGVTTYQHDAKGRVVASIDPGGAVTRFVWDAAGRLVQAVDPNGAVSRYEHDARGFLRRAIDPLGGSTEYDYDPLGRLVRRTDPLGRATEWAYDPGGRLEQRILATGESSHWWYDPSGRVRGLGAHEEAGPLVEVERDPVGRPVAVTEPGLHHELGWDVRGRLTARSRNGLGLAWEYDLDGRRTAVTCPDGSRIRFQHDAAGRVTAAAHDTAGTVRFERDPAGRLVARTTEQNTHRWHYADGAVIRHEVEGGGRLSVTTLDRDQAGWVVAATTDGSETRYAYDPAGQLATVEGWAGTWTFAYDPAGRLVSETGPDGEVHYAYDAAHQLVERRGTTGVHRFAYDRAGRRVGEVASDGTARTTGWDWQNRPTRLGDQVVQVDALGELAEVDGRAVLWDPVGSVSQVRWLDGMTVLGDDQPWASTGPDGDVTWFDHDWQGSIGPLPGRRDPWGAPLALDPTAPPAGLGYRGELGVDGLVWLRRRAYDPRTRSFLSTDPLPGVPGTPVAANSYNYAANDPIGASDPLGLRPMTDADLAAYREAAANGGWFDTAGDWLSTGGDWLLTGGRYVLGGGMVAVGFLGALNPLGPAAYFLPEPLRPLVAVGNPLHLSTGLGQAGLAFLNGERDFDDLSRHVVNGPSTTFGQGLAIMGGGDISYNEQHGIFVSEDTADWTSGRGGTTYGSIFVTPTTQEAIEANPRDYPHGWDGLLGHEEVHSDQWARHGGGITFPILYGIEEWRSGGGSCNSYEQEAGLEEGGYPPC